jgi:diketogulonate reductase-like aldo/keto reductase
MLKLNNGKLMPALGFGTFASVGKPGESHRAVVAALEAGYRHLDCAWFYQNELEVGAGIKEFLDAHPDVKREELFITTKFWQHLHEPADVVWSINDSLQKLGLDYVDLFLIHWPFAAEKEDNHTVKLGPDGKYIIKHDLTRDPSPTWRAMEQLVKDGKTKSIGVSNWTIKDLEHLLSYASIPPVANQIEVHPFLPNTELLDYCIAHSIVPIAYSPLGSQDQVPGTNEKVSTNKDLLAIAHRNSITMAQLLIAWGIRRGYAVLPKSSNEERIKSNAKLVTLSDEDFEAVNKVSEGRCTRFVNMKNTFGYDVWPEEA